MSFDVQGEGRGRVKALCHYKHTCTNACVLACSRYVPNSCAQALEPVVEILLVAGHQQEFGFGEG